MMAALPVPGGEVLAAERREQATDLRTGRNGTVTHLPRAYDRTI